MLLRHSRASRTTTMQVLKHGLKKIKGFKKFTNARVHTTAFNNRKCIAQFNLVFPKKISTELK